MTSALSDIWCSASSTVAGGVLMLDESCAQATAFAKASTTAIAHRLRTFAENRIGPVLRCPVRLLSSQGRRDRLDVSFRDTRRTYYRRLLDLRVEVEEGVEAHAQLRLDLLAAAFEHVHGYMRFVAVLEFDASFADRCDFIRRQQPHTVYQCQICHMPILS